MSNLPPSPDDNPGARSVGGFSPGQGSAPPPPPPPPSYSSQPTYGQQPGFSQPGYGGPGYGGQPKKNGLAIAALVLGIIGLLLFWAFGLSLLPGLAAIVLGILGLRKSKQLLGSGRGLAIAGLVSGILASLIGLAWIIGIGAFVRSDEGTTLLDCVNEAREDGQLTPAEQDECSQRVQTESNR